jgi:hypothetical protein
VALVIVLLLLALLTGVLGFVVKGLLWLLIIAAALIVAAYFTGRSRSGHRRAGA